MSATETPTTPVVEGNPPTTPVVEPETPDAPVVEPEPPAAPVVQPEAPARSRRRRRSGGPSYAVGDVFELAGHGLVSYPDGTVVTANGTFTFRRPGTYRVTYNNDAHPSVEVTVAPATEDGTR